MSINKAKLKRIKKELDKLFSSGKYLEFLQRVQAEDVEDAFTREIEQSWRTLLKRAFISPSALSAFLDALKDFKKLPDTPDLKLLSLLDRFTKGEDVTTEVSMLKGVSGSLLPFQKKILAWQADSSGKDRLASKFQLLLEKPEKTTKKQLADCINLLPASCSSRIEKIPDCFDIFKKFNLKGAIVKKRKGFKSVQLSSIDIELKKASVDLPEKIFLILITPLLHQLSHIYKNYCADDSAFALEIAAATPFLTELLAGKRANELKDQLQSSDYGSLYAENPKFVREKATTADLDTKIKMLKALETTLSKAEFKGDPWDFLDDIDESAPDKDKMKADYHFLYKNIMAEIAETKKTVPQREQKELSQIVIDILHSDFNKFYANGEDCMLFMHSALASGCLDTKLAFACILVGKNVGDRKLRESAEHELDSLPAPVADDYFWLMDRFDFLCYPYISNLTPFLRINRQDSSIIDLIVKKMTEFVMDEMAQNFCLKDIEHSFANSPNDFGNKKFKMDMELFRKELFNFKDEPGFETLVKLTAFFPEGILTENGYVQMLEHLHVRFGISHIIEEIRKINNLRQDKWRDSFPELSGLSRIINLKSNCVLRLIEKNVKELADVSMENMTLLLDFIQTFYIDAKAAGFLIGISNILGRRKDSGEAGAAPLIRILDKIILNLKKQGNRRR